MAVYVDNIQPLSTAWPGYFARRYRKYCHMMADTEEELLAMAEAIGLKRSWLQGDHFDIVPSKRALAVRHGAIEVSPVYLVRLRQRKRRTKT